MSDDEDNEDEDEEGKSTGLHKKYQKMKIVGRTVQNALGDVASFFERVKKFALLFIRCFFVKAID